MPKGSGTKRSAVNSGCPRYPRATWPAKIELARYCFRKQFSGPAQDIRSSVRDRFPDGYSISVLSRNAMHGRPNRRLGGPVHVPCFPASFPELSRQFGAHLFAAAPDSRPGLLPAGFKQHPPRCGSCLHDRRASFRQKFLQEMAVDGLIPAGDSHLRPCC
jgi:hypothetical protein